METNTELTLEQKYAELGRLQVEAQEYWNRHSEVCGNGAPATCEDNPCYYYSEYRLTSRAVTDLLSELVWPKNAQTPHACCFSQSTNYYCDCEDFNGHV